MRLRLAWGSDNATKQRWTGEISIEGSVLTHLQPLGIEADAPVALRVDGSRVIVAPLEKRGFDGCDVTVRADEHALVRVELRSEKAPQAMVFEASLVEVIAHQLRQPLDEFGSFFLAHRSPGDVLRVLPMREHLVFEPGETWNLKLQPDLAAQLAAGPVLLDVQLRATGQSKPSWRTSQQIDDASQLEGGVDFEIVCPPTEGAYRLTVTARPEEGLATRFVPGQQAKLIATRDVEFVVIDPIANYPKLVDQWLPVLTIDPANPRWWQRLPSWAQVPRLRNRNSGTVGNVRPLIRSTPTGELIELPPSTAGGNPSWQAYTLPVREPGKPHLVEIEYPIGLEQHLAISVIEPDAAGNVTESQQDASLFSADSTTAGDGELSVHRFVIWPRTSSPQLLLVNRHPTQPGRYGKIKLLKQDATLAALTQLTITDNSTRLVAGYLAKPLLARSFGAAEWLDPISGTSVQSWSTFLEGTRRLAQQIRLSGYNGVMISVAADGSGLYPSQVIKPSPRYDTGLLAASGQDPMRKDVLEMMLRVFDREGLRVVPTLQLSAPLPRLEILRLGDDIRSTGIGCVGHHGQSWLAEHPSNEGAAPFYNPLNDRVQAEILELVAELTTRYGKHPSMAGVGVQLSGEGYGFLPGLAWGLDDNTVAEFSRTTGIELPEIPRQGVDRFHRRAEVLLGEQRPAWIEWRMQKISQLYKKLAQQVTASRSDQRLILATEALFAGNELQRRVREAIAAPADFGQILRDHGLDLEHLNTQPEITALIPRRMSAAGHLQSQAIDLRVNAAVEQGEVISLEQRTAELLYQTTARFRLPSFDEHSPFGVDQTSLTVTSQPQAAGASQRRSLVTALAGNDALTIIEGGWQLGVNVDPKTRSLLRTVQRLPGEAAEVQTRHKQPLVLRVYRTDQATVVALINEARWPVQAEVKLTGSRRCEWQKLGTDGTDLNAQAFAGTLAETEQAWQVELQPYDLQAWRFEDEKLRVGELKVLIADIAKQDLEQRIEEIESRAGNLNIERAFPQLQNPGFELKDGGQGIPGWQSRQGEVGTIGLDSMAPHSGTIALRLQSDDAIGVAVQSHSFPVPATGQLMVSLFLRVERLEENAQLQIAIQDQDQGRRYHQFAVLGKAQLSNKEWTSYEFELSDVPFGQDEKLRLQFHLTGGGEVLVDDVQLFDLRFDEARRRALVKRIYAARTALAQGQVVDCLRVVDDYWSRYLVEHVPPTETVTFEATKQPSVVKPLKEKETGLGSRLRGWVPRMWR